MGSTEAAARILVVDDDPDLRDLIGMRLAAAGYIVALAASGEEALASFAAERPRVVITDLRMDGMDGHALFERLHALAPSLPVIILTAHGTIPDAVAATQRGVFGFLTKPFDGKELLARVADAVALSPSLALAEDAADWQAGIVSASHAMDELLRQARRSAAHHDPLLVVGPRGAGKEALARMVHAAGPRAKKPFVALRGAALSADAHPEATLAEALQAAAGGTLFIDGIGELSADMQVRLLPLVREAGIFGGKSNPAAKRQDVRLIAAAAQSLEPAVRAGSFRSDLYYSLGQATLAVPPLDERREDIPLLVAEFTRRWLAKTPGVGRGFAPGAVAQLYEAPWPGNVRQLRSIVEQALRQTVTPLVPASLVRRLMREENEREMETFDDARRSFEYRYLVDLLAATSGNVARAARIAGRNRTEFYKLLARHQIEPAAFK
jgi:two-component system response regulator GlrR